MFWSNQAPLIDDNSKVCDFSDEDNCKVPWNEFEFDETDKESSTSNGNDSL
jgi:hypothetical protein